MHSHGADRPLSTSPDRSSSATAVGTPRSAFERETAAATVGVREALRAAVEACPGQPGGAAELQRSLGVDMKLSWKVFKVLEAPSDLAAAPFVPGPGNFVTLGKKLKKLGAPAELLRRLVDAADRFDAVVKRHAGDRRTFDTMTTDAAPTAHGAISLEHRRAAHRAATHLWGARLEHLFVHNAVCVSPHDDARLDTATFVELADITRIRTGPAAGVYLNRAVIDTENAATLGGTEPLVSDDDDDDDHPLRSLGLVREFSRGPIDELEVTPITETLSSIQLPPDRVGRTDAATLALALRSRGVQPRFRQDAADHGSITAFVQTPARRQTLELALQAGVKDHGEPSADVFADRSGRLPYPLFLRDEMRLNEHVAVQRLGTPLDAPPAEGSTDYHRKLRWLYQGAGLDPSQFTLYRVQIDYPVMLTRLVLRYPMPTR